MSFEHPEKKRSFDGRVGVQFEIHFEKGFQIKEKGYTEFNKDMERKYFETPRVPLAHEPTIPTLLF